MSIKGCFTRFGEWLAKLFTPPIDYTIAVMVDASRPHIVIGLVNGERLEWTPEVGPRSEYKIDRDGCLYTRPYEKSKWVYEGVVAYMVYRDPIPEQKGE